MSVGQLLPAGVPPPRDDRASEEQAGEERPEEGQSALLSALPGAVIELDADGRVRRWNPGAEQLLGWPAAEVIGESLPRLAVTGQPDLAAVLAAAESGQVLAPVRLRCRRKDRRSVEIEVRVAAVQDGGNGRSGRFGAVALLLDVTEQQRLARQLEHQATHDVLTGLPNRALFADRLADALIAADRSGRRTGVLLIDLDRFKEINDTLGHHVGDQLLTQIGPRLTGALRASDTVARLGGDEFAVLLPEIGTLDAAVAVATKL